MRGLHAERSAVAGHYELDVLVGEDRLTVHRLELAVRTQRLPEERLSDVRLTLERVASNRDAHAVPLANRSGRRCHCRRLTA